MPEAFRRARVGPDGDLRFAPSEGVVGELRDELGRYLDSQDVARARVRRKAVASLSVLGPLEIHEKAKRLSRTHRRLAEDRADVEHAEPAHLEEVAQHRRAPPLDRLGTDLLQLD